MQRNLIYCVLYSLVFATYAMAQQSDRDRGIDLYREGKFQEAISALEAAVAANANDRSAWMFLGGAFVHAGDKEKASEAFGRSRTIKQPSPPPRFDKSVKVTYKPRPGYTEEARQNGSSGTIRVAIEFRADGKIGFVFPMPTTTRDLVQPSLQAARGIQFEPAIKDGKPITMINVVEYGYWMQ